MHDYKRHQGDLFDGVNASNLPPLDEALQTTVTNLLTQWMQALAKTIQAEANDEQDPN